MTWQDVVIPILRGLINDFSLPYTYSDGRLEEFVVYSAHLLLNEVGFNETYTISIPSLSISPDPSSDIDFINLVSLKCSLLILSCELKDAATHSLRVVDGPSSLELVNVYRSKKDLFNSLEKTFERSKTIYQMGVNGKAVSGPITNDSIQTYLFR